MNLSITFGSFSPDMATQLKDFKIDKISLDYIQKDADAISRLFIRDLLTDSQTQSTRKKLLKKIIKEIRV